MDAILLVIKGIVESQSESYLWIGNILMVVGALRVIFKPLMSVVIAVIGITPSVSDDSFLAKMLESKIYKAVAYVLDWSASIKLPQKPKV